MVHVPFMLLGLSVASSTTAYRPYAYERSAKITLFDTSNIADASDPASFECDTARPSTDISLAINTCLWSWGDFPLVNFKVNSQPKCANGAEPVTYFYPTTSCTGNPSFRSDQVTNQDYHNIYNKCLFFDSPTEWSMIFRCDKLESQAVASGNYIQAIPPNFDRNKIPVTTKASCGVVTPHSSFDCTIWKPKEPTFLPADTCLTLEGNEGRSVFINKPAICADGLAAIFESFTVRDCKSISEDDESMDVYGDDLDKACHRSYSSHVRSMRFRCDDKEQEMYEDLHPYEHEQVERLVLQEAPKSAPKEEELILHVDPNSDKQRKPIPTSAIGTQSTKNQGGKIQPYYLTDCETDQRVEKTSVKTVDTCVWTFMYKSMEIKSPAVCSNGTQALFATYRRPGCKPEDLKYLGELPEEFDDSCADISKIDSFAFICEGLPESEIGNKGSVGGFLKFVGIMLLIVVLMIALSILSCCLKGAAMMRQANELWGKIMDAFRGKEGAIQL
ncbi:hypothetical protein NA56DRAFT_687752 [Hyaloscypha hepaticicola]|uniref:Uncharacterized protein n=1 Tax=Hyaloscypha hepaticicola TaxID=2082293 RepID=A0A2J6QB29_9HELO|nr:hypothetical protein NA56DRAFT_687752 [Hyaloscypha hepaticicola]